MTEPEPLLSPPELACLLSFATGRTRLAEIGVAFGGTSVRLRRAMASSGVLHLIDAYSGHEMYWKGTLLKADTAMYEAAQVALAIVSNGEVRWHRTESAVASEQFIGQLDFLFIDGSHDSPDPKHDWLSWYPLIAQDGIVAFHDVHPNYPAVEHAYKLALAHPDFKELCSVGSLRILKRTRYTPSPSVLIATATFGGLTWGGYPAALAATTALLERSNIKYGCEGISNLPYMTEVRNILANHFLQNTSFDALMTIDADLTWNPRSVLYLLRQLMPSQRDVLGAIYPHKTLNWAQVHRAVLAGVPVGQLAAHSGKFVVNATPEAVPFTVGDTIPVRRLHGGFTLMSRQALAALRDAHPDYWYRNGFISNRSHLWTERTHAIFQTYIDQDTHEFLSEDWLLSEELRQHGFGLWLDSAIRLTHTGTYGFTGDLGPSSRNFKSPKT